MKNLLLLLSVVLMFSCTPESITQTIYDIQKEMNYRVGISTICSGSAMKIWYCVSKDEYDRLQELPPSCDTIIITTISGIWYRGIINSNSFIYDDGVCIS